ADLQGLTRRRFLRAAGVGTAGAMAAAGAVMGQAGAEVAGAAVPAAAQRIPARRKVVRASGQQTAAAPAAALAVSGPLSFHTITPVRYLDTRFDGGGPFPAQGTDGVFFIFDFGDPDYFSGASNEVPPEATAIACNLTVTGGTSGGNLRAFPGNSDVIPLVSIVNWTTGQTVANYAIVGAATPGDGEFQAAVGLHNASTRGSVHVIVDISGYFV
ncbi:MAG TPA: hypothetical protein VFW32_00155, partial [Actinomycetes bacterium]|nr:hypothetical protein [Actinomycetes bacterium]